MRLCLHIGPDAWSSTRIQQVLGHNRAHLARHRVLYPRAPGAGNHTRTYLAVADRCDMLRHHRGFGTPAAQEKLRERLAAALAQEVAEADPEVLVLAAHQLGSHLTEPAALDALKAFLAPFSEHVEIIAHIARPSDMLAAHYTQQVGEGRARSLALEAGFLRPESGAWWDAARASAPDADPRAGLFPDVQMAPAFPDLARWTGLWESVFGKGCMTLHRIDPEALAGPEAHRLVRDTFALEPALDAVAPVRPPAGQAAEGLARARALNALLLRRLAQRDVDLPRKTWRGVLREVRVAGPPLRGADLRAIDAHFAEDLQTLAETHPAVRDLVASETDATALPDEPAFTGGFRASQYLLAHWPQMSRNAAAEAQPGPAPAASDLPAVPDLPASSNLPDALREAHETLLASPFAPHNRLGQVAEAEDAPPFALTEACGQSPSPPRTLIVGCMKNEAPYIVEWIAHHRAIGVDHFVIYTNGCEDGTVEILERLQAMGVLTHRDNSVWTGKSPQQHALNAARSEPVVQAAEWIIHIDVDEFINVRCGNGTLADLVARVPGATHIAMTWRLFGHNGVRVFSDELVIEQFDRCAPAYCPKPHTAWGFKTMSRNNGAYEKLSCHRPNKLRPDRAAEVRWVNGSGAAMGEEIKARGWRSSRASIGYDLVQLNHYALRSAESFLIKRQRGRALHVDRAIGLHYWIRMDWSDVREVSIQRNLPRLRAERDRLMGDTVLRDWHAQGCAWHRDRAAALRATPEFAELHARTLALRLSPSERATYALALAHER